jgi:hypothetical protein
MIPKAVLRGCPADICDNKSVYVSETGAEAACEIQGDRFQPPKQASRRMGIRISSLARERPRDLLTGIPRFIAGLCRKFSRAI